MMPRLATWVFRLIVLWGAQRLIRWFSETYGEDRARARNAAAADADESRE
ncbi:MAG TPA: hypothetical protein VKE25_05520 [Actinomycetes bacterium]|nr:hypothetical protein [Actinomycetes bacterium]